ncbi:hypothetical protein J19TS2_07910 [Cohnella xylanilytica]|uniref:Uncharacterized protein n=1 Tax=Cohnella xylanilytica TaxID=557555 RepID=A0A841U2R6_9BACL|nr:hypothetical protein [Cohnella xylanilytica]MBB6694825.1 hypothetical protein [Cohnella xylanilytica]GIO11236.1 hypothetical protein J19TS2_07910 [Cohnella xylanilytica]
MHKLVFFVLMVIVWWMLHALQIDEEAALGTLHEGKRAVDRAAHAAAQQTDRDKLEAGVLSIDEEKALAAAEQYLQANLRLGADNTPMPGAFLRDRAEVRAFRVVNENETFPYVYRNPEYGYEVTLNRPGVVLIVHLVYPRMFGVLAPVEWDLKGSAELVY